MQKSLPDYKSYDQNPPKSWRRVYKVCLPGNAKIALQSHNRFSIQHLLREEQRKILKAAEDMKASYAAEEMEKRAKKTQMTSASLQDLGYRKKPAFAGPSRGKYSLALS